MKTKKKTSCGCCAKKTKSKKKKKGFTLIEMLIVIAVIGILATIVIITVVGTRNKAAATRAKADMVQFKNALEIASTDGCNKVSTTQNGVGVTLECTPAGSTTVKKYTTIQPAPPGAKYDITIGSTTISCDNQTTNNGFTDYTITDQNPLSFTFKASGFDGSTNATYTCNQAGCTCSTAAGCLTTP